MNLLNRIPLLSVVLLLAWTFPSSAQTADTSSPDTPPAGSTVITSDELHSDQTTHTSIFNGNVVVVGTAFNLTADEMKVMFNKDNKVDHIIATGNVVITQPGRVTHSGRVDYFQVDDKFVLTDQPVIVDHGNQLSAPKITIYRTNQTLVTEGKPCKTILVNGGIGSSTPTSTPAPLPQQ
jgi:lipopolysaccharide transport protein LptA